MTSLNNHATTTVAEANWASNHLGHEVFRGYERAHNVSENMINILVHYVYSVLLVEKLTKRWRIAYLGWFVTTVGGITLECLNAKPNIGLGTFLAIFVSIALIGAIPLVLVWRQGIKAVVASDKDEQVIRPFVDAVKRLLGVDDFTNIRDIMVNKLYVHDRLVWLKLDYLVARHALMATLRDKSFCPVGNVGALEHLCERIVIARNMYGERKHCARDDFQIDFDNNDIYSSAVALFEQQHGIEPLTEEIWRGFVASKQI